jgi:hypothetical protein
LRPQDESVEVPETGNLLGPFAALIIGFGIEMTSIRGIFQHPALMFAVKSSRRGLSSPAFAERKYEAIRRARQEAETEDAG